MTGTNFRVDRVVKGSPPAWIQQVREGARPASISCGARASTGGAELPVAGERSILLLASGMASDPRSWQLLDGDTGVIPVAAGRDVVPARFPGPEHDESLDAFIVELQRATRP